MTTLQEFRCEVCGLVTTNPVHWFVIRCGDSDLTVTGGILKPPRRPAPDITAVKLMPRSISAAGLTRFALRRSPILPSASQVSHLFQRGKKGDQNLTGS